MAMEIILELYNSFLNIALFSGGLYYFSAGYGLYASLDSLKSEDIFLVKADIFSYVFIVILIFITIVPIINLIFMIINIVYYIKSLYKKRYHDRRK